MKTHLNSRALSPIFASLLILAIVTVIFIPVFIWSTGLTAETRSFWELSGIIATERIVIEEVNIRGGVTNCTIYIRNIGNTAIIADNVFISQPDGSLHSYETPQFTSVPDSVVQGDLMTIYLPDLLGLTPISNYTYTVKVYTERGVGDTYRVVA